MSRQEMIAELREMASQFVWNGSFGKGIFGDSADLLENQDSEIVTLKQSLAIEQELTATLREIRGRLDAEIERLKADAKMTVPRMKAYAATMVAAKEREIEKQCAQLTEVARTRINELEWLKYEIAGLKSTNAQLATELANALEVCMNRWESMEEYRQALAKARQFIRAVNESKDCHWRCKELARLNALMEGQ